jgi:transposase
VLADMAKRTLRKKIPSLREAVPGRFNEHHAVLVRELLDHIDYLSGLEDRLDTRVDELIGPFAWARELLDTIPGINRINAEIVIAEIGVDMTRFPSPDHLSSWAGLCPGNNESAGKRRSGKTRHGDPWLQCCLVEAAHSAARTKATSLKARYWRIARRRGIERAAVAVAHNLLVIIWWMLSEHVPYNEMGDNYLARRADPKKRQRHFIRELERLGLKVTVEPVAA